MANKRNILSFSTELEKFYFSPILQLDSNIHQGDYLNLYAFMGKSDEWGEYNQPPEVVKTDAYLREINKNIIALKKLNLNDIFPVIERVDWTANTYYEAYNENTYLSKTDDSGKLLRKFYVKNKYDQVFKCLWNAYNINGANTVNNIENKEYYYTINHSGATYEIGSFITLSNVSPSDFDGTYKVIGSNYGVANISFSNSGSYIMTTNSTYSTGGTIKQASLSTIEPMFDVGTFDENVIVETSDGYKWKYMYTLDRAAKLKSYDSEWMPVTVTYNDPNPQLSQYGYGSIDLINVVSSGSGYSDGTGTVVVEIVGDGQGARAEAFVDEGKIKTITMLDPGKNYTRANVSVYPAEGFSGSGVQISHTISPIGGHGFSLLNELCSRNIMVSATFDDTEGGKIPNNISFNQIGLLYNPYIASDMYNHANTTLLTRLTEVYVAAGDGEYFSSEYVFQAPTIQEYEKRTYTGRVVNFDSANNILTVINRGGELNKDQSLYGASSQTDRIVTANSATTYIRNSGTIFLTENRFNIDRTPAGLEQLRFIINYN